MYPAFPSAIVLSRIWIQTINLRIIAKCNTNFAPDTDKCDNYFKE